MLRKYYHRVCYLLIFPALTAVSNELGTGPSLTEIHKIQTEKIDFQAENQRLIESLNTETENLISEHKKNIEEIESLSKYNYLLQEQIQVQLEQIENAEVTINKIAIAERKIPSLFFDMIEALDHSIEESLPFQKTDRKNRIAALKALIKRPEVTLSEKYQRILDAYRIENSFGKSISTSKETITLDQQELLVDILRIGRLALFYSTFSNDRVGMWDDSKQMWIELTRPLFKQNIRTAISVARGDKPHNLLTLPFSSTAINITPSK